MPKCVFILDVSKSRCNFITLLGKYVQQKKVGWEVIFSELGFEGSGARKPRREFEGSALKPFFHVFLRLNGASNVQFNYRYHIKASVKLVTFDRENQIIPWQGVYFFTNTVLQKSQEHTYTVAMKNMINTIGKIIHTLVKENTPRHHKIWRECGFSQKFTFFYRSLCFLPYCCANINIGREVRLMLPNTDQEIFDTHICLNF